jgi:hypothetical protein
MGHQQPLMISYFYREVLYIVVIVQGGSSELYTQEARSRRVVYYVRSAQAIHAI